MNSSEISTDAAKQDKLFYIVANMAIVNTAEKTCLILKRSEKEKVFPNKWAHAGGKLEHKDVVGLLEQLGKEPIEGIENILGKLAQREAKEECGLDVSADNIVVLKNKVFVRPDNVPVFMVTLATSYEGGEVELEKDAFTDFAWVSAEQALDYDCINGIQDEIAQAIKSL